MATVEVETQQVPTTVTENEAVEVTKADETTPASEVPVSEPATVEQPIKEAAEEAAVEKEAETEVAVE
ncbi:hypothetical protein A2U01_0023956, partial [Trifolium medium]|nr:hypothetical protein [Trifolium medium]